jgi:NTE family protein
LALRGGGTKGAYEVGALKAMVEMMQPLEYAYDVIVGVSIGAINAGILSLWKRGEEKYAVKYLEDVWANNSIADFWENWPYLGFVEGLWR